MVTRRVGTGRGGSTPPTPSLPRVGVGCLRETPIKVGVLAVLATPCMSFLFQSLRASLRSHRPVLPAATSGVVHWLAPRSWYERSSLPTLDEHGVAGFGRGAPCPPRDRAWRSDGVRTVSVRHQPAPPDRTADRVRPPASRRRRADRLSLLPLLGREVAVGGHSFHHGLHVLPRAGVEQEPVPGAGTSGLLHGPGDSVGANPQPAGLRLLQPRHPRGQGRWLRHVPRPGG